MYLPHLVHSVHSGRWRVRSKLDTNSDLIEEEGYLVLVCAAPHLARGSASEGYFMSSVALRPLASTVTCNECVVGSLSAHLSRHCQPCAV